MASRAHIALFATLAAFGPFTSVAFAHPEADAPARIGDEILPPPPTYKANGVTVDEHTGAQVPVDVVFRTAEGKLTTLGDVLKGDIPTILTFNYTDCPMLCSLQLNGLQKVLPELGYQLGGQYRIVTIDLEPNDPKITKLRDRYLTKLPASQRAGWTYLAGDAASIRRVAEAVGFKYVYVQERAEWAHPAALIFLSTKGTVTRYVYGIDYAPTVMQESIFRAGLSESSSAVGFMNRCYHFDPEANSHARAGVLALRLGAAGFLVLFAMGFGVFRVVRRKRASGDA